MSEICIRGLSESVVYACLSYGSTYFAGEMYTRTGLHPPIIRIRNLIFVRHLPISAETETSCRSPTGGSESVIHTPLIVYPPHLVV